MSHSWASTFTSMTLAPTAMGTSGLAWPEGTWCPSTTTVAVLLSAWGVTLRVASEA